MTFDLDNFVDQCREAARSTDAIAQTEELLRRTVADPEPLRASIAIPHESEKAQQNGMFLGYQKILFEDASVTVFLVDTMPGIDQPPHNHLIDAFIGVYQGAEINRFYAQGEGGIRLAGEKTIRPAEVLPIRPKTIHAINAEAGEMCRAIHVYLGSLSTVARSLFDPDSGVERLFDLDDYFAFCRPS